MLECFFLDVSHPTSTKVNVASTASTSPHCRMWSFRSFDENLLSWKITVEKYHGKQQTQISYHFTKKKEFYTDSRSHPEVGDIGKWRLFRNSVTRSVLPAHAISQVPDFNFNNDSFFSRNDIQHQTFSQFEAQQRLFVLLGKWTEWPLKSLKRLKHFADLGSETVHRT